MDHAARTFDNVASDYEAQLQKGLSLSGEAADYFAHGRVEYLTQLLRDKSEFRVPSTRDKSPESQSKPVESILDFGCGVGNATHVLASVFKATRVTGLDCSAQSVRLAEQRHAGRGFQWTTEGGELEHESFDLVYTSGVFHHIEPELRQQALAGIVSWLKPGGIFALFENNPWNPGTRWVMSRIPFDRDAKCLSPFESRRRLQQAGLEVLDTRYLFFFPKCMRIFRPFEGWMRWLPMGAQYLTLARRVEVN